MASFYAEPVYDLKELARHNLHMHTVYSRCGNQEMLPEAIVRAAERAGLATIAITDHFHDPDFDDCFLAQVRTLTRHIAAIPTKVRVIIGGELSSYGPGHYGDRPETNALLPLRLYATNHWREDVWDFPEDKSPRGYAKMQVENIRALMLSGRADCIAHPLIGTKIPGCEPHDVTRALTDNEIGEIGELSHQTRTALELNLVAVRGDPELCKRIWHLGKEAGAYFHLGTDAHRLENVDTAPFLALLQSILGE